VNCPARDHACERDEVDVGIGNVCGPWFCGRCGWSQADDLYDIDQLPLMSAADVEIARVESAMEPEEDR
jgi:hypothetical protein